MLVFDDARHSTDTKLHPTENKSVLTYLEENGMVGHIGVMAEATNNGLSTVYSPTELQDLADRGHQKRHQN